MPDEWWQNSNGMGNGLKELRKRKGWSLEKAATEMGMSKGGYIKIERGERRLSDAYVRRAVIAFNATAAEVVGLTQVSGSDDWRIDTAKLARLLTEARERLGALPEDEAHNLVEALISASRRPPGRT